MRDHYGRSIEHWEGLSGTCAVTVNNNIETPRGALWQEHGEDLSATFSLLFSKICARWFSKTTSSEARMLRQTCAHLPLAF